MVRLQHRNGIFERSTQPQPPSSPPFLRLVLGVRGDFLKVHANDTSRTCPIIAGRAASKENYAGCVHFRIQLAGWRC